MTARIERDALGEVEIPADALWGVNTQRAVENFPVSGLRMPREIIRALALIKWAAARANRDLGLLAPRIADAIQQAAGEVRDGRWDDQFPVDVFQTGSGTSTNMNVNEVIANRANQILGGRPGDKRPVHPNDHVNLGQSSNDCIPTALHIALVQALDDVLLPSLAACADTLRRKAAEFQPIVKIGRTHLQDATPVRLGQVFGGYARQAELGRARVGRAREDLLELALGGTAVGTGINTHPEFARRAVELVREATGIPFREAEDHFEAQSARDAMVFLSGAVRSAMTGLMKIANDVRWLSSGPRCGLGELRLPALQAGSSIMPGKVNPVIPEVVIQVAAQVTGNDAAVNVGGQWGNFELNAMLPVMGYNLLQSVLLSGRAVKLFTERALAGLEADAEACRASVERSLALVTPLALVIGYDRAAALARTAYETGRTIREVALQEGVLPEEELARVLDPEAMTRPTAQRTP